MPSSIWIYFSYHCHRPLFNLSCGHSGFCFSNCLSPITVKRLSLWSEFPAFLCSHSFLLIRYFLGDSVPRWGGIQISVMILYGYEWIICITLQINYLQINFNTSDTHLPNFTTCFQHTVLTYVPFGFLLVLFPILMIQSNRIRYRFGPLPWSKLLILRMVSKICWVLLFRSSICVSILLYFLKMGCDWTLSILHNLIGK